MHSELKDIELTRDTINALLREADGFRSTDPIAWFVIFGVLEELLAEWEKDIQTTAWFAEVNTRFGPIFADLYGRVRQGSSPIPHAAVERLIRAYQLHVTV